MKTVTSKNVKFSLAAAALAGALVVTLGQGSMVSANEYHGSSIYSKLNNRYTEEKLSDEEIYNRAQNLDLSYGDFGSQADSYTYEPTYTEPEYTDFHGSSIYGKLNDRYTDEKLSDEEIYNRAQNLDLSYGDFN
ncbi:hypothetical protein D3X11_04660 [Streptococcus sp. X16XC17]|uniref:hypothetical protein n=1 Tax=unclassified Streptococcus TaxID=2608887 RepID=UPI00066FC555|nr:MULTISPECIES: hypothetical protein [unclassified Streptococcus]TCD46670.1 hypothetical protein D3X11_04660 [Streptococcus sp. X16XC17]